MENSMKQEELLQYMKDAIEVETDLATQEQTLERSLALIEKKKPTLHLKDIPQITANSSPKKPPQFVWGCVCIGTIYLIPIGIYLIVKANKMVNDERSKYASQYANAKKIDEINTSMKKEYENAIRDCNDSIALINTAAKAHIDETKTLLEKLYNKNIIYPKYCTLPALTSIYEYFMTGRCTELTGPHGAYNLYEDEVRKDMIINRLDTVIENLEQIRNNQYMLYQQVKSIKENSDAMVSELQQIKGYSITIAELTALNAYYAARTERNTRISMYYDL